MKRTPDDRPALEPEEQRFVERLGAAFAPPPLSPARRVALDEEIAREITRRGTRGRRTAARWLPAMAAAAIAGVWLASSGRETPVPAPQTSRALLSTQAWEEEVLLLDASFEPDEDADLQVLPEEYLAIASALL